MYINAYYTDVNWYQLSSPRTWNSTLVTFFPTVRVKPRLLPPLQLLCTTPYLPSSANIQTSEKLALLDHHAATAGNFLRRFGATYSTHMLSRNVGGELPPERARFSSTSRPKPEITWFFFLNSLFNFVLSQLPYFSIYNAHLMYNAHPKLFRHSFWCIDNAHDVFFDR